MSTHHRHSNKQGNWIDLISVALDARKKGHTDVINTSMTEKNIKKDSRSHPSRPKLRELFADHEDHEVAHSDAADSIQCRLVDLRYSTDCFS